MFLLASAVVVLVSCNKNANGYTINGTVAGFDDGTKVYISQPDENAPLGLTRIDSTEIKGGKFEMKGEAKEIDLKFLEFGKTQEYAIPFVYENGSIAVHFDKDKVEDTKVSGSKNNDMLMAYDAEIKPVQKKMSEFQANNMAKIQQAQTTNDATIMQSLQNDFNALLEERKNKTVDFVKKNKDGYISLILLEQLGQSQSISSEEFKKMYDELSSDIKTSKKGKELGETISKLSATEIGKKAPDFKAPDTQGKMVSLHENLGKVTLIDFWASWCAPCRQENPNVVRIYNQFKDKGLAIIGVSLDKDADRWIKAIEDDKLTWLQVSNLKEWKDPIAKEYGITAIPATYLLDEKGVIIARDLSSEELEVKLNELLK